jgi:hypothetical protein
MAGSNAVVHTLINSSVVLGKPSWALPFNYRRRVLLVGFIALFASGGFWAATLVVDLGVSGNMLKSGSLHQPIRKTARPRGKGADTLELSASASSISN